MDAQDVTPSAQPGPHQGLRPARSRWRTRATASLIVVLAIVAAAPWVSATRGALMAWPPAATGLCALSAVSALLAGVAIVRLPFLPWWIRAIGAAAASYAGFAFGEAIPRHAMYPALFRGESFWRQAPFWAQGSYVAIAIILLALIGNLIAALRRSAPGHAPAWRWQVNFAFLASLSVLVAGYAIARPIAGGGAMVHPGGRSTAAARASAEPQGATSLETRPGELFPSHTATSAPDTPGANIALDDNGGAVESITSEYGPGLDGRRLIDGKTEPALSWRRPAQNLPVDIVLSFYKHAPAFVTAVVIELGKGDGSSAPKDVEIWTAKEAGTDFVKAAAATLAATPLTQAVTFPSVEARYVKVRVLSVQGPVPNGTTLDIPEVQVLEARRAGYTSILDRNPDVSSWKGSPRYVAQRGIEWLQPSSIQWQRDHNCFGCHIQAQAVMGLAVAKNNDYIVSDRCVTDLVKFTESRQQADGSYEREPEPSTQFAAMGMAYWDDLARIKHNPTFLKSVDWLLAKQQPTGEMPNGSLGCGPLAVVEGPLMATANSFIAFERAFVETRDSRYKEAAERALTWIDAAQPKTTQDKVFKILALTRSGGRERKPAAQQVVEQLILEQHPSGGWRECEDALGTTGPNAFSTGQVLYAFKQAGVSISSSPFIKGVRYLIDTQAADGSWKADTSTLRTMGAAYAPTTWAVIGLAGSFGQIKTGGLQITTELSPEQTAARRNLEIILDASGSMKLPLGKSTRIATARQVLRQVLEKIPDDFNVGLRLYAHRYRSRDKQTCTDTELMAPIQKIDRQKMLSIVDRVQPKGETPLVYSILQAPADLKALGGGSVIVITDGEESCGGDPVPAAEQLKAAGIPITLNIAGFTVKGQEVERQLMTFAETTGGHYYSAQDGPALARALMMAAMAKFHYVVYDANGTQVAKGVAGPLSEALQPGSYKVVVQAGEQELVENVTVAAGTDVVLKVAPRGDRFEIVRDRPQTKATTPAAPRP